MRSLIFSCIILLFSINAQSQESYPIDKVNHIELYKNQLYPSIKENDLYTKRYLLSVNPYKVIESSHHEKKAYLDGIGAKIISINEVDKYSKAQLIATLGLDEWVIAGNDSNSMETLQLLPNKFCIYRLYQYNTDDYFLNKNVKSWNIRYETVTAMHLVSLPNNAIYLQGLGNNYIVPYQGKFLTGFNKINFLASRLDPKKYNIDKEKHIYQTLQNFNSDRYYFVNPLPGNKCEIRDQTKKLMLNEKYDSIVKNQYFLVAKKGNKYDIYNTLLKQIETNADNYNFDGYYIQILKNNQLSKKGVLGKIDKLFIQNFYGCGTVPSYDFEIKKVTKANIYTITSRSGYNVQPNQAGTSFKVTNASQYNQLTWLDGSKRIGYRDKFNYPTDINLNRNLIIVKKNNKIGLANFDTKQTTSYLKLLTDISYDKVVFKNYNEPVFLNKNGLVYIFNQVADKNFVFGQCKSFTERKNTFIRCEKANGVKGWFDLVKGINVDDQ